MKQKLRKVNLLDSGNCAETEPLLLRIVDIGFDRRSNSHLAYYGSLYCHRRVVQKCTTTIILPCYFESFVLCLTSVSRIAAIPQSFTL
jgi:hypothetical protein